MDGDPRYYRPFYLSDEEEESDLSSDDLSDDYITRPLARPTNADEEEDILMGPDFSEFAKQLRAPVMLASGPTFATANSELAYGVNELKKDIVYGPVVSDISGTPITSVTKNIDNVIILESINRDFDVYPQPTVCQLLLPREYRSVSSFEIVELSLTSTVFYFNGLKYNVQIQIVENERRNYESILSPTTFTPLVLNATLREGSYTIDSLLTELQTQLNTPPPFFDFVNGYTDFADVFQSTGDYSLNFNYPGDYYYDSIHKAYIPNPTREVISSLYFESRFATTGTLGGYTVEEIRVAYYYPVLKEYLLDPATPHTEYSNYISQGVLTDILYNFQGLLDVNVIKLTSTATPFREILDIYRLKHTFRYSPVNQYTCSYNPANNIVCIQTNRLNQSLVSLLNAQYDTILRTTTATFPMYNYNMVTGIINTLHAILNGMYQRIQTNLVLMYGGFYGEYTMSYFTDFTNQLLLRDGMNIKNPILNNNTFNPANISTNILGNVQVPPTYYWPNMVNIPSFSISSINEYNHPFDMHTLIYDTTTEYIDSTGSIYTEYAEQSGDVLIHIPAGKYVVFQFTSKYRQTMQVELLSKPASLQYPEWNSVNVTYPNNSLFNIPYSTIFPNGNPSYIQNSTSPVPIPIFIVSDPVAEYSLGTDSVIYTTMRKGMTFTYNAPRPSSVTSPNVKAKYSVYISILPGIRVLSSNTPYNSSSTYNVGDIFLYGTITYICTTAIPFNIVLPSDPTTTTYFIPTLYPAITLNTSNGLSFIPECIEQKFTDDCSVFIYHSQAAYYADTGPNGALNENPFFYKYSYKVKKNDTVLNFSYMVYEGETYYIFIRPTNDIFTSIPFRILSYTVSSPIYELNTQLATSITDPSYFDPTSPTFDYTKYLSTSFIIAKVHDPDWLQLPCRTNVSDPSNTTINIAVSTIYSGCGYDTNNISNNATDYIPFVAGISTTLIDPINSYVFNKRTQYDLSSQSYQSGLNYITDPVNVRYPGTFTNVKPTSNICNYNVTTYISTIGDIVANLTAYRSSLTSGPLYGYSYDSNANIVLGSGPCGFTFLPSEGTWSVNTITFKGQSLETAVQVLGVFPTYTIYQQTSPTIVGLLPNASAVAVLSSSNTYPLASLNGSYYTYSTILTNGSIRGSVQVPSVSIQDVHSFYSVISFGGSPTPITNVTELQAALPFLSILTMENLAGSPIPYPYAYSSIRSGLFYDGISSINQKDVVITGPQINTSLAFLPDASRYYDKSVSVYEQSMPIVNSHLHYINHDDIIVSLKAFVPWTNYSVQPTNIIANIPGFLLLKGSTYGIVSYSNNSTEFTPVTTLTDDIIFPPFENTTMLAITGNTNSYAFVGYSSSTNTLRIKLYNPVTHIVSSVPYTLTIPYDPSIYRIGDFVFSDTQSWWITYTNTTTGDVYIYGVQDNGINKQFILGPGTRGFLAMDTSIPIVYYAITVLGGTGFNTVKQFLTSVGPSLTDTSNLLIGYNIGTFIQMVAYEKNVYFIDGVNFGFFRWDTSTRNVYKSLQILSAIPIGISIGPVRSAWLCFSTSPYVMGHSVDILCVDIACQIFFPAMKINLSRVTALYTSITNTSNLVSEWQHSEMFVYSTFNSFSNDILINGGQWGLESNYMVCDTQSSGYEYNAYIKNIPVVPNWTPAPLTSNAPNAYYLAIRGLSPTEDFNAILRWKVPNRTDFGYIPISTLMNEIASYSNLSTNYNISYLTSISTFNPIFIGINTYGLSIASGLSGSTIHTYGFSDFIEKYSTIHSQYIIYQNYLSIVNTSVTNQMNKYLTSNLQYIIPPNYLTRMVYTDPIPFSLQWSTLTAASPVVIANDVSEWGLGWNLGFSKNDTPFGIIHYADSLFRIQNDYIYLRLNPEFNINRLDTGSKENYSDSREASGITNQYYCKLLLNGFGNKATTFTHNPVPFNPNLPKISKLSFEWIDARGNILSNASSTDSEWNMTIHLQEQIKTFDFTTVSIQTAMSTLRPVSESEGESLEQQEFDFASTIKAR